MNNLLIPEERISIALDQIKATDGTLWESFANSFLSSEFPQLRPVGGMHDAGRDAFLYESDSEPGVFIQHSVQETFEAKIRNTVNTLESNGFKPIYLIYCSPRDIIKSADLIKKELRLRKIGLDIRDRGYFISFRNHSTGQIAASEELSRKLVDPIIKGAAAAANIPHALTEQEEKNAIAYFQISVPDRISDKSISKLCYETLLTYALREATPEKPLPMQAIIQAISILVPGENRNHLEDKVKGSIARLKASDVIKHQTHPTGIDGYTLSHSTRATLNRAFQQLIGEMASLLTEIVDIVNRVAEANEIDYSFDSNLVAKDVLMLCDYFLLEMGRSAAKAFESKQFFNPARTTLSECASVLTNSGVQILSLKSLGLARFLDLVPQAAEVVLKKPTTTAEKYLSRVADAYYLIFALRQSPELIQAVGKVVGKSKIILDASIIVPCMAEIVFPEDEKRYTSLLKSAIDSGIELYVSHEAIEELHAVIRKARAIYTADQAQGFHYSSSGLVDAFNANSSRWDGSFLDFVDQFAGSERPEENLKIFLKHHLFINFLEFANERQAINKPTLEEIAIKLKPTRRQKQMDDTATDILVRNDVTCLLLIEQLRLTENPTDSYGFSWWWLTSDRAAYALDRNHNAPKSCICMSPDFLVRYLSIQPLPPTIKAGANRHLPLAVEVAAIGLVPPEIKSSVEKELLAAENFQNICGFAN